MVVCYTGGGTLGHIYPALAVYQALAAECAHQAFFIGRKNEHERAAVEATSIPFYAISSGKLRRYRSKKNFSDPFLVIAGFFQALVLLMRHRPQVLFSKGGFVTPPVVFAAFLLRIPVVSHESDSSAGLATRLNSRFSRVLCVPHTEGFTHLKSKRLAVTGSPLRHEILTHTQKKEGSLAWLDPDETLILVLGGSSGAEAINALVDQSYEALTALGYVYHQCGRGKAKSRSYGSRYTEVEFITDELPALLERADLIISRAGANAIAEFAYFGSAVILLPLSRAASRGDQVENAQHLANKGAAKVLFGEVNAEQFIAAVTEVLTDQKLLVALREAIASHAEPQSAKKIAQILKEEGSCICSGE